ncbi:MAG: hypothetical protein K2O05_01085 [Anaeroplasmataceae bacterium]|nr:hypothetical protein [Anaeroplasmataceae bacterium]MDE7100431.1 hypothetical protein [Anaeroplasmataceae bacterium]
MAFQNRVSEYPNRKKMTVVSESTNTSGQKVLTVDVERAEGRVSSVGTALDADSLNAEVKAIVENTLKVNEPIGVTHPAYDCSCNLATTEFVWKVLIALGHDKINGPSTGGGSSSSGT